ncbi:dTMP kinase [[Eubacterium] cellulosolvens]
MPKRKDGFFIVIEGVDGSGKSLHSRLLHQELIRRGEHVTLTAEPSRGEVGEFIKYLIRERKKSQPIVETLLFTADRLEHLESEIEPSLKDGFIVVCDRYYYSTFAYQGAQGVDIDWIIKLNSFARKPDLAFYLDIPPDIALQRIKKERTFFEMNLLLKKVRTYYLSFVKSGELILINSNRSIAEVKNQILKISLEKMGSA